MTGFKPDCVLEHPKGLETTQTDEAGAENTLFAENSRDSDRATLPAGDDDASPLSRDTDEISRKNDGETPGISLSPEVVLASSSGAELNTGTQSECFVATYSSKNEFLHIILILKRRNRAILLEYKIKLALRRARRSPATFNLRSGGAGVAVRVRMRATTTKATTTRPKRIYPPKSPKGVI